MELRKKNNQEDEGFIKADYDLAEWYLREDNCFTNSGKTKVKAESCLL